MTETRQSNNVTLADFIVGFGIACILAFLFWVMAGVEADKWTHGIVMVNDTYVHYDYHNYRGDLNYRVGADPTQSRVLLCRVYPTRYARCVKTKKESSLAPLSDFDALVLERLYESGLFNRKYKSITYTQKTEAP